MRGRKHFFLGSDVYGSRVRERGGGGRATFTPTCPINTVVQGDMLIGWA